MEAINNLKKTILGSIVLAAAGFSGCAPQSSFQNNDLRTPASADSAKIVGGELATADYQKQHGVVQVKIIFANGVATCTGSLIAKNIVMTAAHCLYDSGIQRVAVLFALDDENLTKDQVVAGTKGSIHPDYNPNAELPGDISNDIALIKLAADAPSDFSLAELPTKEISTLLVKGAKLTLSGFGMTNSVVRELVKDPKTGKDTVVEKPSVGAGVLRLVNDIVITEVNQDKEILMNQADPKNIKGACHGDSGGPAYLNVNGKDLVVGVTSRGTEKLGNCTEGVIYSDVIGYLDWIASESDALNKPELAVAQPKPTVQPKKPTPKKPRRHS